MKNVFASIPEDLDHEFFELLLHNDKVKIERIVSMGHTSPDSGWHDQEGDEWVLVLQGAAIICFENNGDVCLGAGDHITITAHTKHRVKWTDPEIKTIWLTMHF
ncbi:MAG: cupin domain-containing protein [Gammaproteobacteria bacterium]|nr:cupin domain-containing protein [Gammaproteobacteria bacterium]